MLALSPVTNSVGFYVAGGPALISRGDNPFDDDQSSTDLGGVLEARRIHDLCRDRGVPVWCGGMLETGVGRALNLALAANVLSDNSIAIANAVQNAPVDQST